MQQLKCNATIKGINSLQLINSLDEINLKSLDLSNNLNSLDDFMGKINSFTKLESLKFCLKENFIKALRLLKVYILD